MKIFARNCFVAGAFVPALVEVEGSRIKSISTSNFANAESADHVFETGFLIPGLIDLQINGLSGVDFSTADDQQIARALKTLSVSATTSICPTVISSPIEQIRAQLDVFENNDPELGSVRNLGVHLEGPYISSERRGAHAQANLRLPKDFEADDLDLTKVKILTLAPELPGANNLIAAARAAGAIVSLGHSNATSAETQQATLEGAQMCTHIFNGMREIHQREPGMAVAALVGNSLHFGIIADGEHVSYELVELAFRVASSRAIIVSDASAALFAKQGDEFELGGSTVIVDEIGNARRPDGTLASSGMTQLQAIENAVAAGLNREMLLLAATKTPADFVGETSLGRIEPGAFADLVHYEVGETPRVDFVIIGGYECQF